MTQRDAPIAGRARTAGSGLDRVRAALASCGGLGYAPVASGTFGTLGGVALAWLLARLAGPQGGGWFLAGAGIAAAVVLAVGIALGGWAERYWGFKDPKPFVLDEVLGYLVALMRVREGVPGWRELALAFVVFRVFDVVKPPPARRIEFLRGGAGIMLDDLVAGLYSLAVVWGTCAWLDWP